MAVADTSAPTSTDQLEERLLSLIEVRPFAVAELLDMLVVLNTAGLTERRNDCALVLQETFAENEEREGLIKLLELRSDWMDNRPAFGGEIRDTLQRVMKSRIEEAFLDSVGFEKLPPRESLKRLQVLLSCVPGAACLDRTWGFGIVKKLDDFYKRITVDFTGRANHALTFGYASETLQLLDKSHVLAVHHNDPSGFFAEVRDNPGEVVKMVLRSLGPMSVSRMEEEFEAHGLLPDDVDWRKFWANARAALRKDPLVSVPPATRKNEPVQLLTKAVTKGDEAWFLQLAKQRDVKALMAEMSSIVGMDLAEGVAKAANVVLLDRMLFIIKASETARDKGQLARAALLAADMKIDGFDLDKLTERVTEVDFMFAAVPKLGAREVERLVAMIPVGEDLEVARSLLDKLSAMPYALLDLMMPLFLEGVAKEEAKKAITREFSMGAVSFALLLWLVRHQKEPAIADLVDSATLTSQCLAALDSQETGENLRMQHLIADRFEDNEWLADMFARLSDVQRQALSQRIRATDDAWPELQKRSILAMIIRMYPELGERATQAAQNSGSGSVARVTSWRSYGERSAQLRKIAEVDIPANSAAIGYAISLGDLSENFEYQAAKDEQRLLMARQAQLTDDLRSVQGTDFAGFGSDRAGIGTSVTVRFEDGEEKRYHILGEWDMDEALGIMPSRSRIASSLAGAVVESKVELPGEAGSRVATVVAVETLPPEIREWAKARDSAGG